MQNVDMLIISGSAAGFTAAIAARRHNPGATRAIIRHENETPVPCGTP